MRTLRQWLERVSTGLAATLMAVFMIIMVYNVFSRYAMGKGVVWYMEGAQFLNVWAMFIGGAALCATNDHLRVSMLEEFMGPRAKRVFRIICAALTFLFYCLLAYSSYLLAVRSRQTISTMGTLKMSHVYWLLPFASGLSAFAILVDVIDFISGKQAVKEAAGDNFPTG